MGSIDCNCRFLLLHCRQALARRTWSREERDQSVLSLIPIFLICIEEGVTCLWGASGIPLGSVPNDLPESVTFSLVAHLCSYRAGDFYSFLLCSKKTMEDHYCVLWGSLKNGVCPIFFWGRLLHLAGVFEKPCPLTWKKALWCHPPHTPNH